MYNIFHVTEAEQEVLEKLWDFEEGIRQPQLLALFNAEGKAWKRQTLNTFLSRLEEKGLVTRENRIAKPRYTREEYHYMQVKADIDNFYGGEINRFLAAYKKDKQLKKNDSDEMLRILKED